MASILDKVREKATGEDKDITALKRKLAEAKTAQSRYFSTWELNRAFFSGNQWVYWNKTKIERPVLEPESTRVLIEDNRITGIVRTEISKMTKQRPTFTVIPTTAEQEDVSASMTGEKILQFLWKHLYLRIKLEQALLWSRVCGSGFWKVCWDSGAGEKFGVVVDEQNTPIQHHETGAPMKPEHFPEGLPEGAQTKSIATGDVHVEVVSPFEIYPDPLAKTLNDCEWLIQVSVQSEDFVKQRFGVDLKPDSNVMPGSAEIQVPSQVESGSTYKGIKLHEYWERPSADNPVGRRVVWAKENILEDGPNPYKCIPFVMFRSIPIPGRFFPMAIVQLLRGPQTELNKIKSQIVENAQRIGNPAILIAATSNTKVSGVPGEEIKYDDTSMHSEPKYLQPPNMPPYVIEQISRIEQSLQEISGQHEVSQAQVPPGVKAASAINLLQEADDTRLGPGIYDMEDALGEAGTKLLEIVAEYWTDERVVLIAGENHALDAINFKGAALKENTKAEVQTGSMFPQSKAARQAAIQDFLGLAFQYEGQQQMNPRMLGKILKDLDAGALSKLFGDVSQDESQINRENQELAQEKPVKLHVYDNNQAHLEGHTEYQRTAAYQGLSPMAKTLFELHTHEHREHLAAQLKPPEVKPPSESLNYKDAPPDVRRQIEQQAGLQPSQDEKAGPVEHPEAPEPPKEEQ